MATEVGTLVLKMDTREVELGTTDLKSAQKAAANLEKQTKKLGGQVIDARSKFRAMRGSTAQLGMQIQDVAIQAQMGTNAFVILGQQGSQIASLFGPGGALLGAAIAIGAAMFNVASSFGDTAEEAEDLSRRLDELGIAFAELTREERAYIALKTKSRVKELRTEIEELSENIELSKGGVLGLTQAIFAFTTGLDENRLSTQELIGKRQLLQRELNQELGVLSGVSSSYTELVRQLEEEIELVGLSEKAIALRRAELEDMSSVQKRHIAELYDLKTAREDELEATKKQIKAEKELQDLFNLILDRRLRTAERSAQKQAKAESDLQDLFNTIADNRRKDQDRQEEREEKLQESFNARLERRLESQREAAKEERRIEETKNQSLLEASDSLLANQSDRKKEAARLAINLADAEKRENAKQIISDSYAAAMKAYKAMSGIAFIGPALGAAAAGAIIAAGVSFSAKSLTGRALGGQVRPGESYMVGERGPEVLTMGGAGGRIATNESMRSGGASLVYSPTVNITGGATEQDRAIFTAQLRQQKAEIADLLARRRF